MKPPPPRSTLTDTLLPYTTLFRSPENSDDARTARTRTAQTARRSEGAERCRRARHHVDLAGHSRDHRPRNRASARSWRRGRCAFRSEEHTSELQSLMRIAYAALCLKQKIHTVPNYKY